MAENLNQPLRNAPLKAWSVHHLRTLISSLGFLYRNALSSLMTMAVIAIALALPAGMYVLLNNLSHVSVGWDNSAQISLFLKPSVSEKQARSLADKLKLYDDINRVELIHRDTALSEFQRISGFGDAVAALGDNPLPHVLAIQPVVDPNRPDKIGHLIKNLEKLPEVDIAQLDLQWVKRLYTMLEIAQRGIWLISLLLALAVLLVVGNTIRLDIQNRRAEIEVTKLIGATNAFIRRPFLYTGLWYGISSGILAWILTALSIGMLEDSVSRLAILYNSGFSISGLSFSETLSLIAISCTLGLLGSWLAVSRHLHEIEPS
ncbi:MAG: cell division protein FtsX [Gammaproteobacteria bacterium]|nr:MAG: cell division protein FtsX [Gammaproteobacteria bacterium]